MLVPDSEMPGGERVKILDFGIAKGVSELSGPVSEDYRTATDMVLGTATYMAPEQCKGAGNVTAKSDVYSLGVMMYRMCCGNLPFRAEGQGEVMAMHIFSTPKPLREHDASIPQPMADLVARMMSKEPAERPPMTQVAQELEQMLSNLSALKQPAVVLVAPPPGDLSSVSSTLSEAIGQSGDQKAVTERPPRKTRLWLGALVTAGLLAMGLGVRFTLARMHTAAAPLTRVTWALSSNPANAQVVRKSDGKVLCATPCSIEPELGVGRMPVLFRLAGHADEELVLDETQPFVRIVTLRPVPSQPVLETPPPTEQPTTNPPSGETNPAGTTPPVNEQPVPGTAEKPGPPPHVNTPGARPFPLTKRGPAEPAGGKPVKLPTLPKRPGGTGESLLTDDKIEIIQ